MKKSKTIIRSHKIRLRPTEDQKSELFRAFAAARHAWNWGKEVLDLEYDLNQALYRDYGVMTSGFTYHRELKKAYNRVKPDWVKGSTATQEAFDDLGRAVSRYFDIRKGKINLKTDENGRVKGRKDGRAHGWLNWRSKKKHNSFRATNATKIKDLQYGSSEICYSAKVGPIKMCEPLRFDGKVMNATFSYDGQWFWASIQVEMSRPAVKPSPNVVGVDLGIKYLAYTSDGDFVFNPRAYTQAQQKLRRLQRKLDRQRRANNPTCFNPDGTAIRGRRPDTVSRQMARTENKIRRLHTRIKNLRRNIQHHLTARLAKEYGLIIIEDLNVNGMLKNGKLAKALADAGFYEIRRQLEYKADFWAGIVQVVDTWFPSSKLCSGCGEKNFNLTLGDRVWTCDHCGQENERDLNAAHNLKREGIRLFLNSDYDHKEDFNLFIAQLFDGQNQPVGSPVAA